MKHDEKYLGKPLSEYTIDFDWKIILVEQHISRDPTIAIELHVKTSSSKREVPMSVEFERLIHEHVEHFGLAPKGLLFRNRDGGLLRFKDANRYFTLAAKSLVVPVGRECMSYAKRAFRLSYEADLALRLFVCYLGIMRYRKR